MTTFDQKKPSLNIYVVFCCYEVKYDFEKQIEAATPWGQFFHSWHQSTTTRPCSCIHFHFRWLSVFPLPEQKRIFWWYISVYSTEEKSPGKNLSMPHRDAVNHGVSNFDVQDYIQLFNSTLRSRKNITISFQGTDQPTKKQLILIMIEKKD